MGWGWNRVFQLKCLPSTKLHGFMSKKHMSLNFLRIFIYAFSAMLAITKGGDLC